MHFYPEDVPLYLEAKAFIVLALLQKEYKQMVNIWLYSLSLPADPHLYYRQSYWLHNRRNIKKIRRKKIAQKLRKSTDEDCSHIFILIIILNFAIYKLYFDVAEEVLIY